MKMKKDAIIQKKELSSFFEKIKEKKIEIIARALIIKENKILLCKMKGDRHYFLPKNLKEALISYFKNNNVTLPGNVTYFKNKKFFWQNF